jgi:hypothetical protein
MQPLRSRQNKFEEDVAKILNGLDRLFDLGLKNRTFPGSRNFTYCTYIWPTSRAPRTCILGEAHLRRILKSYTRYYNETRTHLALDKDAPLSRTIMRAGRILRPVLGGLHHEYVRI